MKVELGIESEMLGSLYRYDPEHDQAFLGDT